MALRSAEGAAEGALELLREMMGHRVEPNAIGFNAATSACEKGGLWERASAPLEEMRGRGGGLSPNVITYSAMITARSKGGQRERSRGLKGYGSAAWSRAWAATAPQPAQVTRRVAAGAAGLVRAPARVRRPLNTQAAVRLDLFS